MDVESLTKDLLDTNKCYLLDCGLEIYAWMGKDTSLIQRKSASQAAEVFFVSFYQFENYTLLMPFTLDVRLSATNYCSDVITQELLQTVDRPKPHIIRVMEGSETVMFRSKFDSWPQPTAATVPEVGRGKVAGEFVFMILCSFTTILQS